MKLPTHRINFLLILLATILYFTNPFARGQVLGAATTNSGLTQNNIKVKTITAFEQTEIIKYREIPFKAEYIENDEMEYGKEEIIQKGIPGIQTLTYLVTHRLGDEIDSQLINTETKDPVTEIISKGTKIIWKTHKTPDIGKIEYWHKIDVWATKYDSNCIGCLGRTYSGTEVKKGVCAVDPNVVPLGTNLYIEGYGFCRAEDIGGAIKGNKIDLGYKDASKGSWHTGWTTIYLLTNAPE
jgi:3D (Asp-Asp-Asp) domain-containing protein